ncbi:MAG: bifunctional 4-hydroxy-2-oxoglutarate aldolase/2-dehydro-3-deoxy-phosphogluconate aldolase [Sphingobacteriales bacterium]|nr:bifunctional 4-hydroxy-2-oxoglutarate aldolase/2-dehydro-3-deoxy-phosphogluconate aldolase [Sphingobacteriales bacterium]
MDSKQALLELITNQGILPLYYHKDEMVSIEVLKSLYKAGIRTVEYTNRGEAALSNFQSLKRLCETELTGMRLGIGTIKNAKSAQQFIDVGADYLISPGLVEDVANLANKQNHLWIPGCMTATEIIKAEILGAPFIKLFPGNILGPGFLSGIKDIFPELLFMPTGGVELTQENISAWFKAGVCAVGMGSKLITKEILENKQYDLLHENTLEAIRLVNTSRV